MKVYHCRFQSNLQWWADIEGLSCSTDGCTKTFIASWICCDTWMMMYHAFWHCILWVHGCFLFWPN
jgi:hypothetical protein